MNNVIIGDCVLYHGDCLEIMPTMEAESIDAIITDLPYGTTACKWDTVLPFEPMWACIKYVLKKRGAFITTSSQPFTSALVMSNPQWFKYEWIWNKNRGQSFILAKIQPMRSHENVLVFCDGKTTYNYQLWNHKAFGGGYPKNEFNNCSTLGIKKIKIERDIPRDKRYPISSLYFDVGKASKSIHPTQKPVALYEYLIRTYTNEGETVLDMCAGSFSCGEACINTGRKYIGIELERKYFDIGVDRLRTALEQVRTNKMLGI